MTQAQERGPSDWDGELRLAGRALARAGLVHAYGHCSVRLDDASFLVSAARPLGLLGPGDRGVVVPVRGALPGSVLGEVRLHQQVYARRPDVGGVVRAQPRDLMTLSAFGRVPRPRHGFGSYFWPAPPLWTGVQLVRDDASAREVAARLGSSSAVVLRGNGAVVAGADLRQAVALTWFLEDAARVELAAPSQGPAAPLLTEAECSNRAVWAGGIAERMWDYLTAQDG